MRAFRNFTQEQLLAAYRTMSLARRLDEKMLNLLRQGKAFFHIGCSGHEAAQVAAALNFQPAHDWFFPYYRDQAFCLQLGYSPQELLLGFLAKASDPSSGGRQMPQHYGHARLRIISQSSPTGTQYLQAVGCAMGARRENRQEVVYVSSGEGTTSQGDFHEALNWASRERLPIVFHIEDNHYAISVPRQEQTSGDSVYQMVAGYTHLARVAVDGTDFFQCDAAFQTAVKRARQGQGPTVIVSDVVRLLPHSSSDDHRKYRSAEDLEADRKRDPLLRFAQVCAQADVTHPALDPAALNALDAECKAEVERAADWAASQPDPVPESALLHLYAPQLPLAQPLKPPKTGETVVMVDAINHALHEEMERDGRVLVYGQDLADGKGGVFTATRGLSTRFGKERVFNSPLAESSIIGTAIGLALQGFRPVVEIQFGDYIWTAMMQLRNELAVMRYRSNGAFSAPVVIRVPVGGYIHGGLCHSQSIEGYFTHLPGIRVVFPSNAADAKGLLKASIRGQDPVLFLEHKGLYRHAAAARPEPEADYLLPLGQAQTIQSGERLTVLTWGMMVKLVQEALKGLEGQESQGVEVLDLRTLNPLDWSAIRASVHKTGKVLIVHEENLTGGFGAELAARLSAEAFEELDGPIQRVAAQDAPIPYHPALESQVLPQVSEITTAMRQLLRY